MESIGEKLRKVREDRGYTIDQVARDTHITKKFITALEDEAFEQFPGESYLIGFLRNYANYLGLDEKETILLYRNLRIQEQPAPISELLDNSRARRIRRILISLLILGIFLAGGVVIYLTSSQEFPTERERPTVTATAQPATPPNIIQFSGDFIEQSLSPGTRITINQGALSGFIDFLGIDEDQAAFRVIGQTITASILDSILVDINGDGTDDIRLITKGLGSDSDQELIVRVDRFIEQTEPLALAQTPAPAEQRDSTLPLGEPQLASRILPSRTITQMPQRQPFEVAITFTNSAMFRYLTDQGQTQEQFVQSGQTFQITVQNWIRLWLSNAGAAQVRIAEVPTRLGANGEVHTSLITWADIPSTQTQRIDLVPVY